MIKSNLRVLMAMREIDTVKDLAADSGLSVRPLSALYHNQQLETIKIGTLLKVCAVLDCKLWDLITEVNQIE